MTNRSPAGPFTILLVCTGNICRSALAERLGRAYLDEVLGATAGHVRLMSAGTHAVVGSAIHPDSELALQGFGGAAGDFRAQQLTAMHPADADLVLTMTRAHRKQVLALAPRVLARTFTLIEAADLLSQLDDDHYMSDEDPGARTRGLVTALANARSHRTSAGDGDDVPDPIGRPVEAHEEAGELIAAALLPVLRAIAHAYAPMSTEITATVDVSGR